jgi:Arc/MetJ-type ribon-helix-helix transcriptional regulator
MLNEMPQIAVRLSDEQLAAIDAAVRAGRFDNRASAVRAGIDRLLREDREREIDEAYRRGYGRHPQDEDEWVGEMGLALGAELARRE